MDPALTATLCVPAAGSLAVITLDALVSGVHFPHDTPPADAAWKALAVNLSDLAAMGAGALALQARCEAPPGDEGWTDALARELAAAAGSFEVALHTRCAAGRQRRIAVQAIGSVPRGQALARGGARAGDTLWCSGSPGEAGAGLALAQGRLDAPAGPDRDALLARLARPQPRLALGCALRAVASAAIDVSDGIVGDAGHVARASGVRLEIRAALLPLSRALLRVAGAHGARGFALHAGDDYELLFCAPAGRADAVRAAGCAAGVAVTPIGAATAGEGVSVLDQDGRALPPGRAYQHFVENGP